MLSSLWLKHSDIPLGNARNVWLAMLGSGAGVTEESTNRSMLEGKVEKLVREGDGGGRREEVSRRTSVASPR